MGYLPRWYLIIRAARYLGVAPWELEARPVAWMFRALASERAEIGAANARQKEAAAAARR